MKNNLISRQVAIDAVKCLPNSPNGYSDTYDKECIIGILEDLPSAEPEIIRCKDCKYQDENWKRVSVRWLPCMDVRTGSNWYCGSAEREGKK